MGLGEAMALADGDFVLGDGLAGCARSFRDQAKLVVGVGESRIQLNRLLEVGFAAVAESQGVVVVGGRVVGIELDEMCETLGDMARILGEISCILPRKSRALVSRGSRSTAWQRRSTASS